MHIHQGYPHPWTTILCVCVHVCVCVCMLTVCVCVCMWTTHVTLQQLQVKQIMMFAHFRNFIFPKSM